ncbi:hypothetical protein J4434_05345 [Candidatus Woesearchaeota archaeon]|nr:hypothetical protein [Candidatus Woesearchaeota archaeon]
MKFEVHKTSAEEYFKIAEEEDNKLNVEKDEVKKIAFRVVAAQNYFYSIVNLIEAAFAKKLAYHSFSHENRMNKLIETKPLFSNEIVRLYELVDRDQRNKVTYRGENGEKYKNIKRLAKMLMESQ